MHISSSYGWKRKQKERRAKVGNNNNQLRIAPPPRVAHASRLGQNPNLNYSTHKSKTYLEKAFRSILKFTPPPLQKCPPLKENFKFLNMKIFNFIFLWKIWKYFSEFFKIHICRGVIN